MIQKFFLKLITLLLILSALYSSILFLLSNFDFQGTPLLYRILKNGSVSEIGRYNLIRFREVKEFKDIDVLFLGSSHALRSFDPRIFKKSGLTSFNLGTAAQSPLNSYYLLKDYYSPLHPKLIILELYFKVFQSPFDLESFYDLIPTVPLSKNILAMALATHSFEAANSFFAEFFIRMHHPLSRRVQEISPSLVYVTGGYVEGKNSNTGKIYPDAYPGNLPRRQIDYLKKIIRFAQKNHTQIILVTQPLPKEYLSGVPRYHEISGQFKKVADSLGVKYYDFNDLISLESDDFSDSNHLDQKGVQKFNALLLKILAESPP